MRSIKKWKITKVVKCAPGLVSLGEKPFCEHCGQMEPFTPTFCDGLTWWCAGCIEAEGHQIPEDFRQQLKQEMKSRLIVFYRAKLIQLGVS